MYDPMTEQAANDVYDVLVEECGATDTELTRRYFVLTQTGEFCTEFRFCGTLGFGGKFWRNARRWYVNCYSEDMTSERQKTIDAANMRLSEVKETYGFDD